MGLPNLSEETVQGIEVLVCSARKNLTDSDRERLAGLIRQPLDWVSLLERASGHGLIPLVERHLLEIGAEQVPSHILSRLKHEAKETAVRTLFLSAELLRILEVFQHAGIPAIPYKGPVLAIRAYGDVSLRRFDDLDVVVPQKFMSMASDSMVSLGYKIRLPRKSLEALERRHIPGEYAFVHATNGARVEIHTEFTIRHFPVVPNLEKMMARSTTALLNGRAVPAFAVEDDLLLLAVHGAKDYWARLLWVADIAELVRHSQQIKWTELFARAESLKARRMLSVSLILASSILGLMLPNGVRAQIEKDSGTGRLATRIRSQLLGLTKMDVSVVARSIYRIRSVNGFWGGVRYWMRLATSPAEELWPVMEAPPPLKRHHAILRPLRLWRRFSPRVSRSK